MLNRYSYVGNSPLGYTDPTGHMRLCNARCEDDLDKKWSPTLPSVPIIPLKYKSNGSFDPQETWKDLSPEEAITRTILSEEGRKTTDPVKRADPVGVAWVIVNRTNANPRVEHWDGTEGGVLGLVLADGQFLGMIQLGQARIAADPENHNGAYGQGDDAGRRAYWEARKIAQGVLDGTIPDPTHGGTSYADAYKKPDGHGDYVKDYVRDPSGKTDAVFPYEDDRTRFWGRNWPRAYSIPELTVKYGYP